MKRACSFAFMVLLFLATSSPTAPAPLPQVERGRFGELVLDARTAERSRLAALYLKSDAFFDKLLSAKSLTGETNQRIWLQQRILPEWRGTLIRVRVTAGNPVQTREILEALVDVLTERPLVLTGDKHRDEFNKLTAEEKRLKAAAKRDEVQRNVQAVLALRRRQGVDAKDLEAFEQLLAHIEFEAEPMLLGQPPRMVR